MITLSNNTKDSALLHQVEEIYEKVYTSDSLLDTVLHWGLNCTNYIPSSVLKTSEFSRVCSKSENSDVINSRDEIYLVFTFQEVFFFIFYTFYRHMQCLSH